jgi:hypothetical protein
LTSRQALAGGIDIRCRESGALVDEVYKVPQVPPLCFTQTLTALYPKRFRCLELLPYMYTSIIKHAGFAVTILSTLVAAEAHEALILVNCVGSK